MSYESFQKALMMGWFEKYAYPHELEHARGAFDGDVEAAFSLSCALQNHKRGDVAVAMWRCKVPKEAFRAYFSSVWDHDHRYVIDAAKTRRTLAHMFRYAAFPLPAELPDVVTVWRGSSYLPFNEARTGYSWTTDKDLACWFAMRFAEHNGSPLVLTADIAKRDIALFTNDRKESEVVLMRPPAARIDGDVSDWTAYYQRKQDAMNSDRKAYLRILCITLARLWQSARDGLQGVFLQPIAQLLARKTTQQTARVRLTTDRRELCRGSLNSARMLPA